jgi:hypothetical protein
MKTHPMSWDSLSAIVEAHFKKHENHTAGALTFFRVIRAFRGSNTISREPPERRRESLTTKNTNDTKSCHSLLLSNNPLI